MPPSHAACLKRSRVLGWVCSRHGATALALLLAIICFGSQRVSFVWPLGARVNISVSTGTLTLAWYHRITGTDVVRRESGPPTRGLVPRPLASDGQDFRGQFLPRFFDTGVQQVQLTTGAGAAAPGAMGTYRSMAVGLPLWPAAAAMVILSAYLHGRARGVRLADSPRCRGCRYRLDAVPALPTEPAWCICPECGTRNRSVANAHDGHGRSVPAHNSANPPALNLREPNPFASSVEHAPESRSLQ